MSVGGHQSETARVYAPGLLQQRHGNRKHVWRPVDEPLRSAEKFQIAADCQRAAAHIPLIEVACGCPMLRLAIPLVQSVVPSRILSSRIGRVDESRSLGVGGRDAGRAARPGAQAARAAAPRNDRPGHRASGDGRRLQVLRGDERTLPNTGWHEPSVVPAGVFPSRSGKEGPKLTRSRAGGALDSRRRSPVERAWRAHFEFARIN